MSRDALERDIQSEEIGESIASMKSGKAPVPGGFLAEFYKAFSNSLCTILLLVFSERLQNHTLPLSLYQAIISLILKKNKNPLECGSNRPISLLNCDYKILAKLLSPVWRTLCAKYFHPIKLVSFSIDISLLILGTFLIFCILCIQTVLRWCSHLTQKKHFWGGFIYFEF